MRVFGDHHLITIVFLPRNISSMMVPDQDHPFFAWFGVPLRSGCPAIQNLCAYGRFTEHVRASVHRVCNYAPDCPIDRQPPYGRSTELVVSDNGKRYLFTTKPQQYL